MVAAEAAPSFVGRRSELAVLRAELATVGSGHPRVVLVEGPAGIGKSALVEQFLSGLTGLRVLRATGEQWEAFLAFGIADQLMRAAGWGHARILAPRDRSLPIQDPIGVGARFSTSSPASSRRPPS